VWQYYKQPQEVPEVIKEKAQLIFEYYRFQVYLKAAH
jgi:hypothetical protein